MGRIGVVIVNWNAAALMRRCLEALRRQTLLPDRVVVVDNASVDDSRTHLEAEKWWVEVILLRRNVGFALANNIAVRALRDCTWIALLNPDAFPEDDWLEVLVAAAHEYPDCQCFGSCLMDGEDVRRLDGTGDVYHVSGAHWRRRHGRVLAVEDGRAGEIFSPCAAAALYRREAFLEVGGFDGSFFCYAEDVDLGFRFRLAGYKSRYVPEARVSHMGSAITGRRSDFTVYHGHRNLVWVFFKNSPWPLLLLYLPQHVLLNVASLVYFGLRGQGCTIVRAKWDALRGLPRILRERRVVQGGRRVSWWELRRSMAKGWLTPFVRRL